jgi:hypothetical protein
VVIHLNSGTMSHVILLENCFGKMTCQLLARGHDKPVSLMETMPRVMETTATAYPLVYLHGLPQSMGLELQLHTSGYHDAGAEFRSSA